MFGRWGTIHAVMIGTFDYNQADALMTKDGNDAARQEGRQGFDKVEMLVSLYFPELKTSFQAVDESRDRANKICTQHRQEYQREENDPRFAKDLLAELPKFMASERTFKDHIARLMVDVTK